MASIISAGITSGSSLSMTGDTSGQLQLQTNGSTTALTIDTSQNVGIGTVSPRAPLSFGTGVYTAGTANKIRLYDDGASSIYGFNISSGALEIIAGTSGSIVSYTNGAERMRIDSSGKVGIGMTPTAVLSIQTVGQNFGGGLNLKVSGGTSNFEFVNGGDNKLYLGYAGSGTPAAVGNFATNGTYTATSDIRKKKDISYTFNGLEIVNALKPAQGRMLEDDDTSPLRPMFIAQDMVDIIPALVSNLEPAPSNNPLLGIDYASIAPILVKAIQEQQTIINDLKARVETLEAK